MNTGSLLDDRTASLAELAVEELSPTPTDNVKERIKTEKDLVKTDPEPNWHATDKNQ